MKSNYYTNFIWSVGFTNMNLRKLRMIRNPKVIIEILIFSMVIGEAYAQDDYVVTRVGDTIIGSIIIHQNSNSNIDQLSLDIKDSKRRHFKATDLRSFWSDSKLFRIVKYMGRYQFMEVQMDGYLSLLRFRAKGEVLYNGKLLHKLDGSQLEVPRLGFRKLMVNFLTECPNVVHKLEEKEYKLSNLKTVIEEYNVCIDNQSGNNSTQAVSVEDDNKPDVTFDSGGRDQQSSAVLTMLEEIKSKFQSTDNESADFNSVYADLRQKIIDGEAIPKYLISALKDSVSRYEEVVGMVEGLIESLPK